MVNLPVVLVYGYGRGSCHLDFCVDVCLQDRRWARASVPLWCILLLAGVVGFTNTIIINIIVVLTGSKLCFTINRQTLFV